MKKAVTFGEIMLRLNPHLYERFVQATEFCSTYSGAEANVAVSLANYGVDVAFVMFVLEKPLKKVYQEIDVVTTPAGKPVAMVHVNNCTSEINAWVDLFTEVVKLSGSMISKGDLFERLFNVSKESDKETGKLFACNFLSGKSDLCAVSFGFSKTLTDT